MKNSCRGTHTPTQGLASTSRMCTAMDSSFALTRAHWHGITVGSMYEENPRVLQTLYCRGKCKHSFKRQLLHNTCGNCWLGTARQFSHGMRGEGGSGVTLICVPVNSIRQT